MKDFIKFINDSPTSFEAIGNIASLLDKKGYEELSEKKAL